MLNKTHTTKKRALRGSFQKAGFTSAPRPKKLKRAPTPNKEASKELRHLTFKFVSHGGHADCTAVDPRLRKLMDHCIENADLLKGHQHLGYRGYIKARDNEFGKFISKASGLVKEVRQWYIKNTVRFFFFR